MRIFFGSIKVMTLETTQTNPFSPANSTIIESGEDVYGLETSSSNNAMLTNLSSETLMASGQYTNGEDTPQMWGDSVSISAFNADGSSAALSYNRRNQGFAIAGGSNRGQIDYDPSLESSEFVTLDFDKLVQSAEIGLGSLSVESWQGYPETGAWTAYDDLGNVVASGELDPTTGTNIADNSYLFGIESSNPFSKLRIEATPYGNGVGPARSDRNSSFTLQSLTYVAGDLPSPTPTPEAPQATNDMFNAVQWSNSNELDVLANDIDPDSTTAPTITGVGTTSQGGTVSINEAGDRILYTPADGFAGEETFEYTITDDSGLTDTASVNVTVTATDPDPDPGDTGDDPDPGSDNGDTSGDGTGDGMGDGMDDGMNMGGALTAEGTGLNLWSDPDTWGGVTPQMNDDVVIPEGVSVVLDVDTPNLEGVTVNGNLIFSETHEELLEFTADWLLVNGGTLQIGTEANPFDQAEALITLDGEDIDVMDMGMGGRFLMINNGGTLDMHGDIGNGVSWTQLSAHANPGDSTIQLSETVTWEVGDEIAIAPSGFDAFEAEKRTIVAISANGQEITLDNPLDYQHWGEIETIDGKPLDMRAEVGLLSRNIVITSPEDARDNNFGFHAMFMENTDIRISGVEFEGGGQMGRPGRYPVHWHLVGDADGDYINNSSIHSSFQRGIVTHGTNNVTVDSNVVYDVFSHAYVFAEVGTEFNNVYTNNLGMQVKRLGPGRTNFSFPVDNHFTSGQAEHRSSVFWGQNYYNTLIGNHAAGTEDGNGFYFDSNMLPREVTQAITLSDQPIVFRDNVAHSNQTFLDINPAYGPLTRGHGLLVDRFGGDSGVDIRFENFTTYKNENSGVWIENARHILSNAMIADSSTGVIVMRSTIEDSVITQKSPNTVGGVLGVDRPILDNAGALGGGIFLFGTPWGVEPTIRDVTFIDIDPAAITVHKRARPRDGSTISGVTLINTQPIYWGTDLIRPLTETRSLIDLDGSLTGTGVPTEISGTSLVGDEGFVEEFNAFVLPLATSNS